MPTPANRRQFLQTSLMGAAATAVGLTPAAQADSKSPPATLAAAAPVDVGAARQLFFDERLVDRTQSSGVSPTMNPPGNVRRVLVPDRPWEALGCIFYGSVVDDGGALKLYYGSYSFDGHERKRHVCLASSRDGLTWEKRPLGITDFQGSKANNILPIGTAEAVVMLDPQAPAERRYRMVMTGHWPDPATAGVYVATSADGLQWQTGHTRVLPLVPDSQPAAFYDDRLKKYVVYLRAWNPGRTIARAEIDDLDAPWPYDKSVAPHHVWGKDKIPTLSREWPTVMARDDQDPENLHLYTSCAMKYAGAADTYLAFPAAYLLYKGNDWKARALNGNDGPFEVQVAASRDGIAWTRWRQPYVAPGFYDGLDLRLVSMGYGMVRRGPSLYQYFVGWPYTHGRPSQWERDAAQRAEWIKRDRGGIYCAEQRVDGFVSLDAAPGGGTLTTRPLMFRGNRLHLNINTAASGSAKVALLEADGRPIAGFTAADCEVIGANAIDYEVRWKQGPDLGAWAGKPVRLKFVMRNTKLYALQFTDDRPT